MIRLPPLFLPFALAACVGPGAMPDTNAGAPAFMPIAFFSGHTEGDGRLRTAMSGPKAVHVSGEGRVAADGTLTLVQRIAQQGKRERSRTWSLRPTGPGSFEGSLSDAVGPVSASVAGNRLHIRLEARGGIAIEQWLTLQPGGRVAHNHLVARKFGLRVAVLDEIIRKRSSPAMPTD